MKLPNGYGSIVKLSKGRRNKYGVLITTGWDNEGKQLRKYIGYTNSYQEGLKLLAEYHKDPYNIDYKKLTFADIWNNTLYKKLDDLVKANKMSKENIEGLTFAFNNHCKPLYEDKILELKYKKMQDVIDNSKNVFSGKDLGYTARGFIKTVCVKIFECAINEYDLPIQNPAIKLSAGEKVKSNKHIPFTDNEMSILWGMQFNDTIKILLIYAYSGLRPNEIFITKKEDIHLDENYFVTGSKTKAGKNRVIPIHPKVKHLFEYFYKNDCDRPFTKIYDNFNYDKYKREFSKLMEELNFNHTPYDGRHTFITKMKYARADEYLLKLIVGHSIGDITEKVYTHRKIEELYNEILKIN